MWHFEVRKFKITYVCTMTKSLDTKNQNWECKLHKQCCTAGMSNMRPFASTPAARTKDTAIWSFNGQHCSFYNLNWINVRCSQKNSMLFFSQNVFYTWKYDRLFPKFRCFFFLLHYFAFMNAHCMFLSLSNKNILQ